MQITGYHLKSKYKRILLHIAYWCVAALFMNFFFWPTHQFPQLSLFLIAIVLPQSVIVTYTINYWLIPRFLFQKKYILFLYILIAVIVFSIWVNILSLSLLLIWANMTLIPTTRDLAILLAGNYLIIFFAVVVHFIAESYRKNTAKEAIEKQKMETELKLNQANLELLKNQIHPHFLFNTLNNLYGLCLAKSDNAPGMVLKIADLLDYILYKCNSNKVWLSNEIDFLNNYIELERIRVDKRMQLDVSIEKPDSDIEIPPLLLFPFVENAFKHSAKNNSGKRNISITLTMNENEINFEVKNNFVSNNNSNNKQSGLGLDNVKKRLKLIYGTTNLLTINKNKNEFEVILSLPVAKTIKKKNIR